jgi:hypothetical protein
MIATIKSPMIGTKLICPAAGPALTLSNTSPQTPMMQSSSDPSLSSYEFVHP